MQQKSFYKDVLLGSRVEKGFAPSLYWSVIGYIRSVYHAGRIAKKYYRALILLNKLQENGVWYANGSIVEAGSIVACLGRNNAYKLLRNRGWHWAGEHWEKK